MKFDSYHPAINFVYFAAVIAMTLLSGVFYVAYAAFCLMPMALQIAGERKFAAQRMRNVSSDREEEPKYEASF